MKNFKRYLIGVLSCITIGAGSGMLVGCENASNTFVVGGSSSVSPLMSVLADAYMEDHDVSITVTTTDSGTGIANAQSGTYAIGMASKKVEGYDDLVAQTLCMDGIACIVHTNCTLENVTKAELKALYTEGTPIGPVTNCISRESGSGTFSAFNELVGFEEGDMRTDGLDIYSSTSAVLSAVSSNSAGNILGYISMGSLPKSGSVKALNFESVEATVANVASGTYALSRPFVLMYNKDNGLNEDEKGFYDWLFTSDAKAIIEEQGYVNL